MAWELQGFDCGNLLADASMADYQFHCVKATGNDQFGICSVDGEVFLGVLQDKPGSGEAGQIRMSGITKVVVGSGETLVANQSWGVDANGEAKTVEGTVTGGDVGDYAGGIVLHGASAGQLATVTIGFHSYKVEAQ